jgi:glycosyltransferase involved in cell wall biosynthesis
MGISLITTVKNEEQSIGDFLSSIACQTIVPDEVVIVDGGSTDNTTSLIRKFKGLNIRCIEQRSNIASGRNLAIRNAQHEIIAVTDAGCRLRPDWLERITAPMGSADVVVGNYRPIVNSLFDACQGSIIGLFGSDSSISTFSPSSRSLAFRRHVWAEVGGYPEWLDYSEDAYFHKQLLARYRTAFASDAAVEWEQRKSLGSVYRQFFRYMEGEALAGLHTGRNLLRFGCYITAILCLPLLVTRPVLLLLLIPFGLFYTSTSYKKFVRLKRYPLLGPALLVIPALMVFIDIAKMSGYIRGTFKLLRRRSSSTPRPNPNEI